MKIASWFKQILLVFSTYVLAIFMIFLAVMMVISVTLGVYSRNEADTLQYLYEQITVQKCYNVMEEYYWLGDDTAEYYNASSDLRGTNNFRYTLYTGDAEKGTLTKAKETYDDEEYLVSTERTNVFAQDMFHESTGTWNIVRAQVRVEGYYCPQDGIVDVYTIVTDVVHFGYIMHIALPIILVGVVLLWLISGVAMTFSIGHISGSKEITLFWLDKIPYDIYTALLVAMGIMPVFFVIDAVEQFYYLKPELLQFVLGVISVLLLVLFILAFYCTTVARLKKGTIFQNTLIWYCLVIVFRVIRWIFRGIAKMFGWVLKLPTVWQAAIFVPVVLLLNSFLIYIGRNSGIFFLCACFFNLVIYGIFLYAAIAYRTIEKAGRELAAGNLAYKTDAPSVFYLFREHAYNLNAIGYGMERAVDEKMKSERFKTELITNVSHDIKTPLTSIINYTDLLAKEDLPDTAREYTEILSRQSARLKKLTEDLIEASKASTGNIPVSLERLSICQIVRQSVGEYEHKMEQAGLTVMTVVPPEDVYANVDGRLLWRILDNLYSNVCKYALTGTRVYIVVTEDNNTVCISVKNISREMLNVSSEELTERFVQGDSSRSAEGSGLGLNIAKSLTELQHGQFNVHCDGDLFRSDIIFPIVP
ncbi:MAG: HAMP domain-containing histidine kinase [Clostridia bacterium]|nr:HAMP domain-containing histidine kinase [Clostridia bacterium]